MRVPLKMSELKSYLGLLTYYGKFLPNLSTHLAPPYQFLRHNTKWKWSIAQEKAFQKSKELLVSSNLLIHFNSLVLACDASQYGIRAVLAHQLPDGSERPIGYVSYTQHCRAKRLATRKGRARLRVNDSTPICSVIHFS